MASPKTPQGGSIVPGIIKDLNSRWNLEIPFSTAHESPSRSSTKGTLDGALVSHMTWLSFRDPQRLQLAIGAFDGNACRASASWPQQQPSSVSTLPGQHRAKTSQLQASVPLRLTVDQRAQLKALLRDSVLDASAVAKAEQAANSPSRAPPALSRSQPLDRPSGHEGGLAVPYSRSAGQLDDEVTLIDRPVSLFGPQTLASVPARDDQSQNQPSSSAGFGSSLLTEEWIEASHQLARVDQMPGALQNDQDGEWNPAQDPEQFETPPESRSSTPPLHHVRDDITWPQLDTTAANRRKRPPTAQVEPLGSRKVSRQDQAAGGPQQQSATAFPGANLLQRSSEKLGAMSRNLSRTQLVSSFYTNETSPFTSFGSGPGNTSHISTARTSFAFDVMAPKDTTVRERRKPFGRAETTIRPPGEAIVLDDDAAPASVEMARTRSDPGASQATEADSEQDDELEAYMKERLAGMSPFAELSPPPASTFPFRLRWEVRRISLDFSILEEVLYKALKGGGIDPNNCDDYNTVWDVLRKCVRKANGHVPQKSSLRAWENCKNGCSCQGKCKCKQICSCKDKCNCDYKCEDVKLAAKLVLEKGKGRGDLVFALRLCPLSTDQSSRLTRRMGSLKFLQLQVPTLQAQHLPLSLKSRASEACQYIGRWLVDNPLLLLGRSWQAFFPKPTERRKPRRNDGTKAKAASYQVFLVASNAITDLSVFLQSIVAPDQNLKQPSLKLFSRIALSLSSTAPVQSFRWYETVYTEDATSDQPQRREFDKIYLLSKQQQQRFREPRLRLHPKMAGSGAVMNDGCALISQEAARRIAKKLGLDYVPSAFQCRIGGSKGIWMVDCLNQHNPLPEPSQDDLRGEYDPRIWIEITASQKKFDLPLDVEDLELELVRYSRPPRTGYLNYQLISVLVEGGVPLRVFGEIVRRDIADEAERQRIAMEKPTHLAMYVQRLHPSRLSRGEAGDTRKKGAMPGELSERIQFMLQSGFNPNQNAFLMEHCRTLLKQRNEALRERGAIPVGRATTVFIVPDPLNILAPDECHICFSTPFKDELSQFSDITLQGLDVVIARSPTNAPSDVQKLRAVFRPELAYKDVLVLPSQSIPTLREPGSLASLLSGGDYDGDTVLLCWDPDIVESFKNFEGIYEPPPEDHYGIKKERTRVESIYPRPDFERQFLRNGLAHHMAGSMLGIITNYYESWAYKLRLDGDPSPLSDPRSLRLATLLGMLVDGPKQGLTFTEDDWGAFKKKEGLPLHLKRPAYRQANSKGPYSHPIDWLVLYHSQRLINKELTAFQNQFGDTAKAGASWFDSDLTEIWKAEEEWAKEEKQTNEEKWGKGEDLTLAPVLKQLKEDLEPLINTWKIICGKDPSDEDDSFRTLADDLRERFLAIKPLPGNRSSTAMRWGRDSKKSRLSTDGSWDLLKASCLFSQTYDRARKMAWWVCGEELGRIKATKTANTRVMTVEMASVQKINKAAVQHLDAADSDNEELDIEFDGIEGEPLDDSWE